MTRDAAHCTFCDLIHGAAEVSICHEDADAIAFMDIQPVNNGHVLVVPRKHMESLREVPAALATHLFEVTMRLAGAVSNVTACPDVNIVVSSGEAAGQDEPHFHVHIIPRRAGDGFDIPLPFNGSSMPDRTVLDAYAARIIAELRDPTTADGAAVQSPAREHRNAHRRERVVAVSRYDEANAERGAPIDGTKESDEPDRELLSTVDEGAHGELRYEPAVDRDRSPG